MGVKEIWNNSPKTKRRQLAKALGYKTAWGNLSYAELGRRGGAMLQKDLRRVWSVRKAKVRRKKK